MAFASLLSSLSFGFCSSVRAISNDGAGCRRGSDCDSDDFLDSPSRDKRLVLRVRVFERAEETLTASESGCSVLGNTAMSGWLFFRPKEKKDFDFFTFISGAVVGSVVATVPESYEGGSERSMSLSGEEKSTGRESTRGRG